MEGPFAYAFIYNIDLFGVRLFETETVFYSILFIWKFNTWIIMIIKEGVHPNGIWYLDCNNLSLVL
jgi:hypothetical protein